MMSWQWDAHFRVTSLLLQTITWTIDITFYLLSSTLSHEWYTLQMIAVMAIIPINKEI